MNRTARTPVLLTVGAATVLTLAACGGSGPASSSASTGATSAASAPASAAASSPASAAPSSSVTSKTKLGITVIGGFGEKPALTIPGTKAPAALTTEVLSAGSGKVVVKGDTLVVNYLGETWTPKNGAPNVFDNSFDKKEAAGFQIGTGAVIKGWDQSLVGQKLGSRLLVAIPPALAYGSTASSGNELSGQSLVFVVDLLGSVDKNASATGAVAPALGAGFPKITSEVGKKPAVTSVAGLTAPTASPISGLLIKGTGPAIDTTKSIVMQLVQTDTATGTKVQATWGGALQVAAAAQVMSVVTALKGQNVGTRAVVVLPKSSSSESVILILDVVAQY